MNIGWLRRVEFYILMSVALCLALLTGMVTSNIGGLVASSLVQHSTLKLDCPQVISDSMEEKETLSVITKFIYCL